VAIPTDVQATISRLDRKIKQAEETKRRLEETKRRLLEAFEGNVSTSTPAAIRRPAPIVPVATPAIVRGASLAEVVAPNSTDLFREFLSTHGPATRAELLQAGIPGGSISWLTRRLGRRREDGRIELAS